MPFYVLSWGTHRHGTRDMTQKKLEDCDLYFKKIKAVPFESKVLLKLSVNRISLFGGYLEN